MSKSLRYTLIGLGIAFIFFLLWFFSSIVVYLLISAVLALMGNPIVTFLGKLRIGRFGIPVALRALIAIICIYGVFIGFFWIFIPVVADEANKLAEINADTLIVQIQEPLGKTQEFLDKYHLMREPDGPGLSEVIEGKINSLLNVSIVSALLTDIAEVLGNLFIALFSITFITFFFLQDQGMLTEAIILVVPKKHIPAVRHALASIKHLLIRYFLGIGAQLTGILILVTLGMMLIGLNFKQSMLIGLTAAAVQIIPYLGPLIGSGLGILMGLAFHIDMGLGNLLPLVGYMTVVYLVVHAIDNFIFQPFIFGNRVYAHPLEIFLVIMMAGSIGGVTGMILAIPAYTILRVFAKEFFNNLRVVKKLTEKI